MTCELIQVPYDKLDATRHLWLPFVKEIAERQRCFVEQRLADVYRGDVALVLVMDKEAQKPVALCGYSICQRGPDSVPKLVWLTGDDASVWLPLYTTLELFFRSAYPAGIEAMARPGWSKFLKANGYRLAHVHYVKDF